MSNTYTGDLCMRCESKGRVPGKGIHRVKYNIYEEFICDECLEELKEENELYYASIENED